MAPQPKLTLKQIGEIRTRHAADPSTSQAALAEEYGVGRSTIAKALADNEPEPPAQTAAPSTIVDLPLGMLFASPLNPRHTIDDTTIAELAENIAIRGLLQNLVVRPRSENNLHEIINGERRYRALMHLANHGRWSAAVPCLIREVTDAEHIADALTENLQRENVPVLEEADAIARLHALDPELYSTQAIATAIGRKVRYIQQRLQIANNLCAPAKTLLRHNLMTFEAARLLAPESTAAQLEVLEEILGPLDDITDENDHLVENDKEQRVTAAEVQDELNTIHAARDREKAAAARAAAPAPDAQMRLDSQQTPPSSTALSEGVVRNAPAAGESPAPEPAGSPVTKSHIYHAHRRKSLALQKALASQPSVAVMCVCYALLVNYQDVVLLAKRTTILDDNVSLDPTDADTTITRLMKPAKLPTDGTFDPKHHLAIWRCLDALHQSTLMALFAALIARQVITPAGFGAAVADQPIAHAIATTLGIPGKEAAHGLSLIAADLAGLRKPALLKLADETSTPGINDEVKTKEIVETITKRRKVLDYVIPTLRFLTEAEAIQAMKDLAA